MKVWITGGSGMVGKNLVEHSKSINYQILIPTRYELDLRNKEAIVNWLSAERPDCVIHAAGKVGGIHANIAHPTEFLSENVEMGVNVITSCIKSGINKLINLGSSCMYPKEAQNPLKVESLLTSPLETTNEGYALSKIVCQKLCEYHSKQNVNSDFKTLIPCNIYGKYDSFNEEDSHLIPSIIKKVYEAKLNGNNQIKVWGKGTVRREFMYAEDLADAIWFCLENIDKLQNSTNIGLGYDFTVLEYYKIVSEILDYKGTYKMELNKPEGMKQKIVDIEAITKMGWKHKTDIRKGIQLTYDYFLSQIDNEKI